jgi:hypothetical protein
MKTTLLVPVRNGADYIFETLSLLSQTSCKIIVSDNFSTDATAEIVSQFPEIDLIKPQEPLSMLEHWTWASSQVDSEYLRLVSHDDLIEVESVHLHEEFLDRNREYSTVRSPRKILFSSRFSERHILELKVAGAEISDSITLLRSVAKFGTNTGGEPFTTTIRVSTFKQIDFKWGGDAFGMCELNTWIELARLGKVGWVADSAGLFRVHGNSFSSSLGSPIHQAKQVREWINSQKEFPEIVGLSRKMMKLTTIYRAVGRTCFYFFLKVVS